MSELRRFNSSDDNRVHRAVQGKYVLYKDVEQQIAELKARIQETHDGYNRFIEWLDLSGQKGMFQEWNSSEL
jgi:hypothetical protein